MVFRGAGAFLRMLSRASLLFALNSGCLNSHAYICSATVLLWTPLRCTHSGTVGRCSILLVVMPHFVEVVLVQLPDKAREVAVFEVLRED